MHIGNGKSARAQRSSAAQPFNCKDIHHTEAQTAGAKTVRSMYFASVDDYDFIGSDMLCFAVVIKLQSAGVNQPVSASHAGKVYRRRFVSTRLAATLLGDGTACFALCACPALVIKRDCSYISIHFSLEIAEISLPIASSGKSSGDSK